VQGEWVKNWSSMGEITLNVLQNKGVQRTKIRFGANG
jgi:hypothetical protein